MGDRNPLDDRVRDYLERRATRAVPGGLDDRVLQSVRARSALRRRVTGMVTVGAVAVALFGVLVVSVTARHGGSDGSSTTSGGGAATIVVPPDPCRGAAACLTLDTRVTGAELLSGEQRRPLTSCASILVVDRDGAVVPRLQGDVGGRQVSSFVLLPSAAPGTYQYGGSPSYPGDLLDIDDRHYVDAIAGSAQVASGTAILRADGSGSYRITGLMNQARPTEQVSLEVSWQCEIQ